MPPAGTFGTPMNLYGQQVTAQPVAMPAAPVQTGGFSQSTAIAASCNLPNFDSRALSTLTSVTLKTLNRAPRKEPSCCLSYKPKTENILVADQNTRQVVLVGQHKQHVNFCFPCCCLGGSFGDSFDGIKIKNMTGGLSLDQFRGDFGDSSASVESCASGEIAAISEKSGDQKCCDTDGNDPKKAIKKIPTLDANKEAFGKIRIDKCDVITTTDSEGHTLRV